MCGSKAYSQENVTVSTETESSVDLDQEVVIDLTTLKLPPLSLLYANARKNPSIQILEKEKQFQKILLEKEKRSWLTFFVAKANASYGITDSYSTTSDAINPIFYRNGSEQMFWSVGGAINIPLETVFDIPGRIKRQRVVVEKADLMKEQAFDQLKQQIIALYVQIQSNIELLRSSLEYMALYKGASATVEQEFKNRRTTIDAIAETKRREYEANSSFVNLQATIHEQLLLLEIISRTSFVANSIQK